MAQEGVKIDEDLYSRQLYVLGIFSSLSPWPPSLAPLFRPDIAYT